MRKDWSALSGWGRTPSAQMGIFALWSDGILDYQTNKISPFGECGAQTDCVLIGGLYCIVGAGEPRLYRVGSRGVAGHGRRASAVGCFGKRYWVLWQALLGVVSSAAQCM